MKSARFYNIYMRLNQHQEKLCTGVNLCYVW